MITPAQQLTNIRSRLDAVQHQVSNLAGAVNSTVFGNVTAQTTAGAASSNGTAGTVSHSDHAHGTPAAGALGNVTSQAVYGGAPANGSATSVSRSDHVHGTPLAPHGYHANASGNLASFTTEADVPGATVSVTVTITGSDVLITGVFDAEADTTNALVGFCNWNGSDQTPQVVLNGTTGRYALSGTWYVANVTAGTYTAKLRASWAGISGDALIRSTHTGITVLVLEGS
jgi:hypothetical protein